MRQPPGPKPHFLIGNMPLASPAPLETFQRWAAEYGDIFHYRALWIQVYFLNRPDLIEHVLVKNPQNFLKDHVVRNSRWLLGQGLLTAEGDYWKRQRRLIQPAFSRERIASYAQFMTQATQQMLATWKPGAIVDIHQEMMQLTLRIVVRSLFDSETPGTETISRSLDTVMQNSIGARLILPPFFRRLPLPSMKDVRRAVSDMNAAVYDIIRQRHASGGNPHGRDFLSLLMNARDEDGSSMSDQQLRDEVLTFLLAGHETTALALSWAFYLLSQNPEAEAQLHLELVRVLAGGSPEFTDIPALPFTENVVKETLRLYPPAWSVARTVINNFELDGYRIPRGANVVMSQWIMHRDPRFFAEPEKFDPARWSRPECQNLPRFAYFPFGGGPRQCIGASFATTEALLILAAIAFRFRLARVDNTPVQAVPSLTLRPKQPIPLRVQALD